MLGNAPGNSAFDKTFLLIQAASIVIFAITLLLGKRLPAGSQWILLTWLAVDAVALPLYWYLRYPPLGGLDGAGRLFVGGPLLLLNLILGTWAVVRQFRAG